MRCAVEEGRVYLDAAKGGAVGRGAGGVVLVSPLPLPLFLSHYTLLNIICITIFFPFFFNSYWGHEHRYEDDLVSIRHGGLIARQYPYKGKDLTGAPVPFSGEVKAEGETILLTRLDRLLTVYR